MKATLNAKIKRRESFRPFAPSVMEEAVAEWFEEDDSVPFMMQVFQVREEKRKLIPAVTHVDGSGRLQTVTSSTNPRYHKLIENFRDLTGIPMVLNTSFNENEPVVCKPEEALDCFLRTKMDKLVLGNVIIARRGSAATDFNPPGSRLIQFERHAIICIGSNLIKALPMRAAAARVAPELFYDPVFCVGRQGPLVAGRPKFRAQSLFFRVAIPPYVSPGCPFLIS